MTNNLFLPYKLFQYNFSRVTTLRSLSGFNLSCLLTYYHICVELTPEEMPALLKIVLIYNEC